jgi:hypothetical protein
VDRINRRTTPAPFARLSFAGLPTLQAGRPS